MIAITGLILLAIFIMASMLYVILKVVAPILIITIMSVLVLIMLIPFIWLIHPWFELLIIVLLIAMIVQRQKVGI